jgi:anionic cell wall polymer biosynthesis LytR-Cps2A-Psr (LCP) family protein
MVRQKPGRSGYQKQPRSPISEQKWHDPSVIGPSIAIKKIVDDLGGLNVNVSQTVDDPKFPTANNGYERFHIEKGWRYFDGETTLKYLRTRHSLNGDFDRMQRQQDVVEAFRKKIFGLNIIWDFPKILRIYSELNTHIATNIDISSDAKAIYKSIKLIKPENLIYKVIDANKDSGLVTTDNIPIGNDIIASIVKPKKGLENYEDIQNFISSTLNNK